MRVGIAGDKRKEKIKNGSQESGVRSQNKEKIKNVARCKQRKKKKKNSIYLGKRESEKNKE